MLLDGVDVWEGLELDDGVPIRLQAGGGGRFDGDGAEDGEGGDKLGDAVEGRKEAY